MGGIRRRCTLETNRGLRHTAYTPLSFSVYRNPASLSCRLYIETLCPVSPPSSYKTHTEVSILRKWGSDVSCQLDGYLSHVFFPIGLVHRWLGLRCKTSSNPFLSGYVPWGEVSSGNNVSTLSIILLHVVLHHHHGGGGPPWGVPPVGSPLGGAPGGSPWGVPPGGSPWGALTVRRLIR